MCKKNIFTGEENEAFAKVSSESLLNKAHIKWGVQAVTTRKCAAYGVAAACAHFRYSLARRSVERYKEIPARAE